MIERNNSVKFIFLILIFHSACSRGRETAFEYWKFYDLNGRVKVVQILTHDAINSNNKWIANPVDTANFREIFSFNETGQLKEQKTESYSSNGRNYFLNNTTVYKYDRNGCLEFWEERDSKGILLTKFRINKHNEVGFPIEEVLITGNTVDRMVTEYLTDKRVRVSYHEGILVDKLIVNYNDALNVTSEQLTYFGDNNDSVTYGRTYRYLEFDRIGNWLKRVVLPDSTTGQFASIEERKIEYYD